MKQTLSQAQGRVIGLDVARGLAVLGMFIAHASARQEEGTWETVLGFADGRSSILFATLAGVSLAILSGRDHPYEGNQLLQSRIRIATRSFCLLVISGLLSFVNQIVAIILAYYAIWFLLAIPVLRMKPKKLIAMAVGFATLGPIVVYYGQVVLERLGLTMYGNASAFMNDIMLTGVYPGFVYLAYVFAGLAIGRTALSSPVIQGFLVGLGASLALIFYGSSSLLSTMVARHQESEVATSYSGSMSGSSSGFWGGGPSGSSSSFWPGSSSSVDDPLANASGFGWNSDLPWPDPATVVTASPHSNTIFEAFGSGGVAIAIIGLCLLGGTLLGKVLYPIASVGSMSLTAYAAHIFALWQIPAFANATNDWPLFWLMVGSMSFCTLWRVTIGRGPLEWVLYRASHRAARMNGPVAPTPERVPV